MVIQARLKMRRSAAQRDVPRKSRPTTRDLVLLRLRLEASFSDRLGYMPVWLVATS